MSCFICRMQWSSSRLVRRTTSTVLSATTSSCAKWFTCVALKSTNCRSSCANLRGENTSVQLPRRSLQFLHADPPFRLIQPPCRQPRILLHTRYPEQLRGSHRQHHIHQSEQQTAGRSIQTGRCRSPSCDSNLEAAGHRRTKFVLLYGSGH